MPWFTPPIGLVCGGAVLITGGAKSIRLLLPPGVLRAASALVAATSKIVATRIENVVFMELPPFLPLNEDAS
jgi:hypothetical protein